MFEDLIDESKFKHLEDECEKCTAEECAAGPCSACTGSCQPEALEDELPLSFLKEAHTDLKKITLENQMYLKYRCGYNIQKFYMPAWTYDCLEIVGNMFDCPCGVYRFEVSQKLKEFEKKSNLRTIFIKKPNNVGKPIEYLELVELH